MKKSKISLVPSIIQPIKCDGSSTYLSEGNILRLKRMFKDEATYVEYMKTLWTLRGLTCEKIEVGGVTNTKDPLFRIAKLTNDLISSLLNFDAENVINFHYVDGNVRAFSFSNKEGIQQTVTH